MDREPLTADEADRIRAACESGKERLVVWALLDTGLRVGELCALDRAALDWQQSTLTVYGKRKRRVVPLPPRSRDLVERVLTVEDRVGISRRTAQRIVKRVAERARIARPCSPHVLRHTWAVQTLQRGLSLPALRALLGHANLSTTARYLNLSNEEAIREYRERHPDP